MTPDEQIDASLEQDQPPPALSVLARGEGRLEKLVVRCGDGRSYDLGRPDSRLYKMRLRRYKWARRKEFAAAARLDAGGQIRG